jgi:hypothetical protein
MEHDYKVSRGLGAKKGGIIPYLWTEVTGGGQGTGRPKSLAVRGARGSARARNRRRRSRGVRRDAHRRKRRGEAAGIRRSTAGELGLAAASSEARATASGSRRRTGLGLARGAPGLAFIGVRAGQARTPQAAATTAVPDSARGRWALRGPGGWASGPERVGPSGSARSSRIGFFFFF